MGVTTTHLSVCPSPTVVPNTRWLRSSSTYRTPLCVAKRAPQPNTQERCFDAFFGNLQQATFLSTATHARSAAVHALHGMHQKAPNGDPQSSATCERPGSKPAADVGGSTGPGPSKQEACRCEDGLEGCNNGPHSSHRPASMRWKNLASAVTSLIPRPLQLRLPLHSSATPATDVVIATNSTSSTSSSSSSSSRNSSNNGCDSAELTLNSRVQALGVLAACYVHCAAVTCSVPVLLPAISESLQLTDLQSAMLTSGHAYLYALALIPMGMLSDRVSHRPGLLAAGVTAWSVTAAMASRASSFGDMMLSRVGVAAAQSTQNIVASSMVSDLFPASKATAMSVYNTAIYFGRSLMFLAVNAATQGAGGKGVGAPDLPGHLYITDEAGHILVPLDRLDLKLMHQIAYIIGGKAALPPHVHGLSASIGAAGELAGRGSESWRHLLLWLGAPGLALAAVLLLSVPETRARRGREVTATATAAAAAAEDKGAGGGRSRAESASPSSTSLCADTGARVDAKAREAGAPQRLDAGNGVVPAPRHIWSLLTDPIFMSATGAAAMNDVGSYALTAWQSQYYERVLHLTPAQYAPVLAMLLPLAGVVGGVGGGLVADRLASRNLRWVTTAGASMLAAPFFWEALYGDDPERSVLALGIGFALSEAWRAPSSIMARSAAPPGMQATTMSVYLCIRSLIGGLGPIAVAQLAQHWGLAHAMALLPASYLASGVLFAVAEWAQHKRQADAGLRGGEDKEG